MEEYTNVEVVDMHIENSEVHCNERAASRLYAELYSTAYNCVELSNIWDFALLFANI